MCFASAEIRPASGSVDVRGRIRFPIHDVRVIRFCLFDWPTVRTWSSAGFVFSKYKIDSMQLARINRKQISKLALRLLKTYQLPSDVCPNIDKHHSAKNLRYLMYRKYSEKTMAGAAWDELIMVCFAKCSSTRVWLDLFCSLLNRRPCRTQTTWKSNLSNSYTRFRTTTPCSNGSVYSISTSETFHLM